MAGSKPGRGSDQFPLRLPDGMRDRIKRHAEANGRSMNSEIVQLIESGLFEADMALMESGREPLREMNDLDRQIIESGKSRMERYEKRKLLEAEAVQMPDDDIPFFDEEADLALGKSADEIKRLEKTIATLSPDILSAVDLIITHIADQDKKRKK